MAKESGYVGTGNNPKEKKPKEDNPAPTVAAAGDSKKGEKEKEKGAKEEPPKKGEKGDKKGKEKEEPAPPAKGKGGKEEPAPPAKGKGGKEEKKEEAGKGKDAKEGGGRRRPKDELPEPEPEEPAEPPPKTASEIMREEAEYRAMLRRQRFKRQWPEITKVKFKTTPWHPPGRPEKAPRVMIQLPELKTRPWVPPYRRRRQMRAKLPRILPEPQPMYETSKLKKIWHSFSQVEDNKNKMILQGTIGCNSKRYSSTACGAQTGCIAVMCRALLEEKTPAQLIRRDVDDVIENGDRYYRQCMLGLKCYKGKPALQLNQLLSSFFLHDTKYTIKMNEIEKGLLAKHPENLKADSDFMSIMEKRIGQEYMMILTIGDDKHFLIWGHPPPPEANSQVKTVCYIFDPHMLNDEGQPQKLFGAGAFLRYAGVTSFVLDFLANYGDLNSANRTHPKPPITLTNVEIVQKEPLIREPLFELDFKTLHKHCPSEWESLHINTLYDKKIREGKYPLASLSAVSLATSRATPRRKMQEFYQKLPIEPSPQLPVMPDRAPQEPTKEQILQLRGEDFFLNCPRTDAHTFGRDDLIPLPKSETVLHSPVDIADQNYRSQYRQLDGGRWILRGTRHHASLRYYTFKFFTGVACCVAALGMLRRLRARAWNEDVIDETLDVGYNLFRESLADRKGPIRRLVLGELKDTFKIRKTEYKHKDRGIVVWGKLVSNDPKVFDLCRGIEEFFKQSDGGILQIPGEIETAIINEGDKFYVYHPWPADAYGRRVSLQGGGKACMLAFNRISTLCEHFFDSVIDLKRKPFAISDVAVYELAERPEPINNLIPVAPDRWVVRGHFHEGDERFPEDNRNKQATPTSIAAVAMASIVDPAEWTPEDVDEVLMKGDNLYATTMEHLDKLGINYEAPPQGQEEEGGETEEQGGASGSGPTGTLAAADVLPRFRIENDCIETDIVDSAFTGSLTGDQSTGLMSLKESLRQLFKKNKAAILTARGGSMAVWQHDNHLYMFDPHGCDEDGLPSDDTEAAACLVRMKNNVNELTDVIMGNLPPGTDDTFNLSPVDVLSSKLIPEIGAAETKLENKAFEWMNRGTAAILMGPRGENSAIGKAAKRARIPEDDLAGRTLALPAAAAFCAATESVPPPGMHQDHMYNFLEAGSEYYINHVKKTGRKDIEVEDLTEKFEMGANTFSIELDEPTRLPLRLPDQVGEGGGGEEEETSEKEIGEGMEEEVKEEPMKQMKDLLFKIWYDTTKLTTVSLLVGDYHQMGVWMACQGKVVAFDPGPTLTKGLLTPQRIKKGDELRLQRLKDEMTGEEAGGDEEDEEAGGEGEEKPEPEPEFVPPESCPAIMVFATPGEFIDKLVLKGGLDPKQCLSPYKLYPVKIINELTSVLKDKRQGGAARKGEGDEGEEPAEDVLVEPLSDEAIGKYFMRVGRAIASVRGRLAQNEGYFMDPPNRDNQDAANAMMGIVVENIEPYIHWKPKLIDAVLKYGDRLYTLSLPNARNRPKITPEEVQREFHVTNFNVKLEVEPDCVSGDIKAGESGGVVSLKKGLKKFFETNKYGVLCCKGFCVGLWRAADGKAFCYWDPHPTGPNGKTNPGGSAALVLFSNIDDLADTFKSNIDNLAKAGTNKFTLTGVKVYWEVSKTSGEVTQQSGVPDEGYEWKVLTAYVEMARGRTILRGTRPADLTKFTRDALLQSSASAVVAACMAHVRRPHLWTRKTVDEILDNGTQLFADSVTHLGYEFRPGEDVLHPLQVSNRYRLGVNYIRYNLEEVFQGKLEQKEPAAINVRAALERFFEAHTHGILWSAPHAVAVWRVAGAPSYYMMEPHACGPTGLRIDALDDGAACVMTFTSPKMMAIAYLQNIPPLERPNHHFQLYAMSFAVKPIKNLPQDPPLVKSRPGSAVVPATSKVDMYGKKRRADEMTRKHPPGSTTCIDAQRAALALDKENVKYSGQRNTSGWLVLADGTQFLSANHSMACRKFPHGSRNNQGLTCCIMAVAMSRVEDVCRWCTSTLDQILESGDQLYQDSYLHYKPKGTKLLTIEQVLRKFYTPGNCVCRVVVYQARQRGYVDENLYEKLVEFFREEKAGVFVAGKGDFAVALFRTPRGFYMFDPADRDRYGRAVAPPCIGKARACFSHYPNVKTLAEKLGPNIPPEIEVVKNKVTKPPSATDKAADKLEDKKDEQKNEKEKEVTIVEPKMSTKIEEVPASFTIYGMEVTSLRRLNQHEK